MKSIYIKKYIINKKTVQLVQESSLSNFGASCVPCCCARAASRKGLHRGSSTLVWDPSRSSMRRFDDAGRDQASSVDAGNRVQWNCVRDTSVATNHPNMRTMDLAKGPLLPRKLEIIACMNSAGSMRSSSISKPEMLRRISRRVSWQRPFPSRKG